MMKIHPEFFLNPSKFFLFCRIMEADQEELPMIFGDNPPENWRENPEFTLYLAEMGNMGV